MKSSISVVIPFHNEESSLKILLPELIKEIKKLNKVLKFEILLIDDFSTDKSYNVCKKFEKNYTKIKVIKLSQRSGQSGALKKGFKLSKGDYVLRMDADLQDDVKNIKFFVKNIISKKTDLVIGYRMKRNHKKILIFISKIYDFILNLFLKKNYPTLSSSYVVFKKKFLNLNKWIKNDHRYLPVIAISNGANKVYHLKMKHRKRKFGFTKYNTFLKILLGFPELIFFLFRLKLGFYKLR